MHLKKVILWLFLVNNTLAACNSVAQQSTNLKVKDFQKGISQPNIQVLDVRTAGEYQTGHLKDAFLADWTNKNQFVDRVRSLDKSKPVYTYCLSGARSGAASNWLRENGYKSFNLEGGIAAWKSAGMPLEEAVKVKQMNVQEYQSLISADKTVLVDVGAAWCPPCKKMEPVIDALTKSKNLEFSLVKIDGGNQTEILTYLDVQAFPTFIIYKNQQEIWRKSGIIDAQELEKQLK